MDWEKIAGIQPPADEEAVMAEVAVYVSDGVAPANREPWKITTVGQADWAMRRLAEAQREAQRYRDEIALWEEALRRIHTAGEWFEERLKEWGVGQRTKDRKTFPLAHGTVATRESADAVEVEDEEAAIEWARQHCVLAIKTKESFLLTAAKKEAGVQVADAVVAFVATNRETGETDTQEIEGLPLLDPEKVAQLREKLGEGWTIEALTVPVVIDGKGAKVPGLKVREGRVTASVTTSGL